MKHKSNNPAGKYLFKSNNKINRKMSIELVSLTLFLILNRYLPLYLSSSARKQTTRI